MGLNWKEYWDIAQALEEKHPGANLLNMNKAEVLKLVLALPGLADPGTPECTGIYTHLRHRWQCLLNGE